MNCPICGGESFQAFKIHGYGILECKVCHHRFCDLQPTSEHAQTVYGDDYFTEGGAGYADYLAYDNYLIKHGERYASFLERFTYPKKMLDVGSAAGFILKGFVNKGWSGRGIEPNAAMAAYARDRFGLDVSAGSLESLKTDQCFSLITMIQVIAHFYDVRQALDAAAKITEAGGFWLIETWNKDSWMAKMMGQKWHEYSPPSVLNWFSPDTLNDLVKQFGFVRVAQGRPPKKLYGSHIKSLFQYKLKENSHGIVRRRLINVIPDSLSVPYPSYDLFWALFQKQK